MVLGLAVEMWGFTRDLPYPDTDEPVFVRPAVQMASTGDLDPHWFGHPGSTVIYPLALFFHFEDVVVHGGPLFTSNADVDRRFDSSAGHFYLVGRFWVLVFAIGAIPLLFLLGRRVFGTAAGIIAALWWVFLPLIVSYGRIVRTDSAGVFFTLLSLLLIVRIVEHSTVRINVFAGLAIGLAVSSRYFLVTLIPILVLANLVGAHRQRLPQAIRRIVAGCGAALACFLATTPYFLLDLRTAVHSITLENTQLIGHEGFSPPGNFAWYAGTAIPGGISWPLVGLAVIGTVLVLRRRNVEQLLLLAFVALFVAAVSMGRLHWNRWVIPVLGIVLLLAADAVVSAVAAVDRERTHKKLAAVGLIVAALMLAAIPAEAVISLDQRTSRPSTRTLGRNWVDRNIPHNARIAEEVKTVPLHDSGRIYLHRHALAAGRTLDRYRREGFSYLITNESLRNAYQGSATSHPTEIAFYRDLARSGCLVARFRPNDQRAGPSIDIWALAVPAADPQSCLRAR